MTGSLYALILSGGSGSKLWPLSKELNPLQSKKVEENYSLLQSVFISLVNCVDDKNILTVTDVKLEEQVKEQLGEMQEKFCRKTPYRLVVEPEGKNTAAAIALGVKYIEKLQKVILGSFTKIDPIIMTIPADCLISNGEKFGETIAEALKLAEENYIVTLGVKPTKADTSLGYIKTKRNKKIRDIAIDGLKVETFIEKPDKESAEEYADSFKYYWNTGIYVFKASVLASEIKKYEPDVFDIIKNGEVTTHSPSISFNDYAKMPNVSIEKAVIEATKKLAMLPLPCKWAEAGSWDGIYAISQKDKNGNLKSGNVIDIDSENSIIHSTSKLVTTVGLKNTLVVETDDALLVCNKDEANDINSIIKNKKVEITPSTVYRPWGYYTVMAEGKGFLTKCICVNPGAKLSVQMHHHRAEHWIVVEGKAKVLKGEEFFELDNGECIDIAIKEKHSLQNPYNTPLKIIEIQHGKILDENDIVRFEDIYGRA